MKIRAKIDAPAGGIIGADEPPNWQGPHGLGARAEICLNFCAKEFFKRLVSDVMARENSRHAQRTGRDQTAEVTRTSQSMPCFARHFGPGPRI
jgi:hypothetical protein